MPSLTAEHQHDTSPRDRQLPDPRDYDEWVAQVDPADFADRPDATLINYETPGDMARREAAERFQALPAPSDPEWQTAMTQHMITSLRLNNPHDHSAQNDLDRLHGHAIQEPAQPIGRHRIAQPTSQIDRIDQQLDDDRQEQRLRPVRRLSRFSLSRLIGHSSQYQPRHKK